MSKKKKKVSVEVKKPALREIKVNERDTKTIITMRDQITTAQKNIFLAEYGMSLITNGYCEPDENLVGFNPDTKILTVVKKEGGV